MQFIYSIGTYFTGYILKIVALFNAKIKLGVEGRIRTFSLLDQHLKATDRTIWFHCASLGEYEQGLPVFEKIRAHYKSHKIVLSFFSPSGFEIRKNSLVADVVVYLPLDTKKNAKRFITLVHPELSVFVKYDIWPNYLSEIKKKEMRAILVSAVFRPDQIYFKFYGNLFKKSLFVFEHIFTQNESSKQLLKSIGYDNVSVSGDTRFDRVSNQIKADNRLNFVEEFKGDDLCVIVGSSWPEDETLFINFINNKTSSGVKYIIAPHNIKESQIKHFISKTKAKTILYSEIEDNSLADYDILIINTIGLLSKIYSYGDIAYVGGAMGTTGLHNTLEPAVFGMPVLIGPNHEKFPEAQAMIDNGGMFTIKNQEEFNETLKSLLENSDYREISGSKNLKFIKKNSGAVIQILDYLRI
ncbi:3-deoxy-D-manno-octulosonic acid transferase [Hyunsoonleella flava]|uniref:3-deoxy-D-manno-octulosonic acid transferase n=1 Tax=Hyunsoonleella flava TaxID=2527939 RepID=A0A4Q9FI67_9FLAO|nr:glycosyltransferase N-terminal domain-containing protein [Hyunsoonleella flava]TBN02384.1 3-deoxy-D-manno-octulosonic acid transferase [Hyunsoonleella flava]